jgi:hypothetical protein
MEASARHVNSPLSSIRHFAWIDSANPEALAGISSDVVPVVCPADRQIMAFRDEVLRWYGLSQGSNIARSRRMATDHREPTADHVVAAAHPPLLTLLKDYARRTNRHLVGGASPAELIADIRGRGARTAVLAGRPGDFTPALVSLTRQNGGTRFAFLIASDEAELSFILAKQQASETRARPVAAVDMQHRSLRVGAKPLGAIEDDAGRNRIEHDFLKGDWSFVAIQAHGDGGHVNLGAAVLCGLYGAPRETLLSGEPIMGCREGVARFYCRKASLRGINAIPITRLRAEHILLLTCNGFCPDGSLYPSNVSSVVAALQGYARTIVAPDREIVVPENWPNRAAEMYEDGHPVEEIVNFFAKVEARKRAEACLIFCGDPWVGPVDRTRGSNISGVDKLAPVKSEILDFGDWLLEIRAAHWAAHHVLSCIENCLERETDDARAIERTRELWSILHRIEQAILTAWRSRREAIETGVAEAKLAAIRKLVAGLVAIWDERFSAVVKDFWLDLPLDEIVDAGSEARRGPSETCDRCGVSNNSESLHPLGEEIGAVESYRCRICGPRWLHTSGAPRLRVTIPRFMASGTDVSLTVEAGARAAAAGWFIARIRDKATGRDIALTRQRGDRPGPTFSVHLPDELIPDLHTARVYWISRLGLSMSQIRFETV